MSILSNDILKNLKCSICSKYLSVLPVKVYPDSSIKCGRCCKENDGGTESLYNSVIKQCLFKCANRYEGCDKLLLVSEVVEHENRCVNRSYNCPICEHKFTGSAYQLLLHYTNQHPNSVLRTGTFSIKVRRNVTERYLYLLMDRIFVVLVDNLSKENILYLSAVSLTPCKNVTQRFYLLRNGKYNNRITTDVKTCRSLEYFECDYFSISTKSVNEFSCKLYLDLSQELQINHISMYLDKKMNKLQIKSELVSTYTQTGPPLRFVRTNFLKNRIAFRSANDNNDIQQQNKCSSSIQTVSLTKILGVKLTDQFRKEYVGYELTPCGTALFKDESRIELICSNCKQLTGCNVFNCQLNKHLVCWECKAWCGSCHTSIDGWNVDIATVNELLLLPCKWKCGEYFSGNDITQHELSCGRSNLKCPKCGSIKLSLKEFGTHLAAVHNNYKNATHFNITGYLKDYSNSNKGEVYFIQNALRFKMIWSKKGDIYDVTVESFDKAELYELAIVCDSGKNYNRIDNNTFKFTLIDNPKFYLRRTRNL